MNAEDSFVPSTTVKVVGATGQISLGKENAGRQVQIEHRAPGEWMIRTAVAMPASELAAGVQPIGLAGGSAVTSTGNGHPRPTHFPDAQNARVHWTLRRICSEADARTHMLQAIRHARRSGYAAARTGRDLPCPQVLSSVPLLRDAYTHAHATMLERRSALATSDGIVAELETMAAAASRASGQSFELFAKRFSQDVDDLVDGLDEQDKSFVIAMAKEWCYVTPHERDEMQKEFDASGDCSLTGIDPWYCPCGAHE